MIKTRFAPSPTGELHIGGARTALFSYLFAKHNDGQFLLRIEDTDRDRFVEGATERIIESLNWLGIVADNIDKPIIQSERVEIYKKFALQLVAEGKAYICTCSKEELEAEREKQIAAKQPPRYSGKCREKSQITGDNLQIPDGAVIRMKMPTEKKIVVNDLVRGKVEFDPALMDDQIILKSDGFPTYHLASVVDDHEAEITHVIRSEEWLSSTPKHVVLYQMFGWQPPQFAHLSMILGSDKSKLSKRHGATSVIDYKKMGYLPEVLVNFMALLGWNPGDEREVFSLAELVSEFKIENVNKPGAVFDLEKLDHFNMEAIKNLDSDKLKDLLKDFGLVDVYDGELSLIQRGGYKTLKEAAEYIIDLREEPNYDSAILIFKKSTKADSLKGLELVKRRIELISDQQFNNSAIEQSLIGAVSDGELSNGDVFWPVRVALSGQEKSPSPVELGVALGKDETINRIETAILKLK